LQVDLDLGNYERFLDITLTRDNNLTTGKVYQVPYSLLPASSTRRALGAPVKNCCSTAKEPLPLFARIPRFLCASSLSASPSCQGVIERERRGDYLGKTVQVR